MLFFRSEDDLAAWLTEKKRPRGETLSLSQLWALTQAWYHNRLDIKFHGRSLEEAQTIFRQVGLTVPFWFIDE